MAFPCYDEPQIRATYDLRIIHGSNFNAVANMLQVQNETLDEYVDPT